MMNLIIYKYIYQLLLNPLYTNNICLVILYLLILLNLI